MKTAEIIASLLEQARDKDALAGDDKDDIFTYDALALREAAAMLSKRVQNSAELTARVTECPCCGSRSAFVVKQTNTYLGGIWIQCKECELRGVLFRCPTIRGRGTGGTATQ